MKTKQLLLRAILTLMAGVGCLAADAQTLVLHLADGTLVNIAMNSKFRMANIGEITYITLADGSLQQYNRDDIRSITYEGTASGSGDVNGDGNVDVADIGSIIDIMAGEQQSQGTFTQCPNNKHPHKIDLGLPSKTMWACCNVGAMAPDQYGDIFAWGETATHEDGYSWANYRHCDGDLYTCHDLGLDISKTAYDAAAVVWSVPWRMPTFDQYKELIDHTTAQWTEENGTPGVKFTASNGAYIFFPAAGFWWGDTGVESRGAVGCYWSSTVDTRLSYRAVYLLLSKDSPYKMLSYREIAFGQSVRAVTE